MNSRLLRTLNLLTNAVMVFAWISSLCVAQPPKQGETAPTNSELTSGLLDLLNEPPPSDSVRDKKLPPLTPADVGIDGEDLGESAENPLNSVRQSMLIAAAYLRREGANNETMRLQSDIVRRLDDLIAQMESAQQKQQQSESNQQSNSSKSQQQQNQQSQQSAGMKSRPGERQDSQDGSQRSARDGEPENPPAQRGGNVAVELSDPKSLQQDVWGQLPPRVRQQMQSRGWWSNSCLLTVNKSRPTFKRC